MKHLTLVAMMLANLSAIALPAIIKTTFPTTDTVIADAVFTRVDGDNAPALQAAINDMAVRGGGTIFLPAGTYTLNTPLVLKDGVTLRGDNPGHYEAGKAIATGTVFAIEQNAGKEDASAAISMESGSGLRELVFWYPRQSATQPIPYPWTIATKACRINDNQSIIGCVFANSYKAITIGPHGNELHTIRNTAICPIKTGIEMDSVTDIGRLDNVLISNDIWHDTELPDALTQDAVRLAEATGIVIHRSDWEYVRHVTIKGLGTGIRYCKGIRGTTNAVMHDVVISQCDIALQFDELNGVGVAAHDCRFHGISHPLLLSDKFTTLVQFNHCSFTGANGSSMTCNGKGTATFAHCTIATENVNVNAGQFHFVDCLGKDKPVAVTVGKDAERVHIIGGDAANVSPQALTNLARIVKLDGCKADCVVSEQPDSLRNINVSANADYRPHRVLPSFKSDNLLIVTDFGAKPSVDPHVTNGGFDNGPAFAAAFAKAATLPNATVYVPAGHYHFATNITVPPHVELRGCYAVPHHTASGGSVLHIHQNRNEENAEPFLQLQHDSGIRGLTIWYPDQMPDAPVPYPWAVRALGRNCWMVDVTAANCWQFADFASCDTTGHLINYIAGGLYRRGIFIANSSYGDVLDIQFNPHYCARLPQAFPPLKWAEKSNFGAIIDYQRAHLEGIVFKDVKDEIVNGTFLYGATDGIAIKGDSTINVLMHGSDTVWNAAVLEGPSPNLRACFALGQLVSLGDKHVASIVTRPGFAGYVKFDASQMWAGTRTAMLDGNGTVILDQLGTLTGPVMVNGGTAHLLAAAFISKASKPAIIIAPEARQATSIAAINPYGSIAATASAQNYRAFANSSLRMQIASPDQPDCPMSYHTDFESPEAFRADVVSNGGGLRDCSDTTCRIVETPEAHSGSHAVLLKGRSKNAPHSFAYFNIANGPFTVMPDTSLTYWLKPMNEVSKRSCLDLKMTAGAPLRDRGITDINARPTHPCTPRGTVGEWTQYKIMIGQSSLCGMTIDHVMLAWDSYTPNSDFEVMLDDVTLETILPPAAWKTTARREGNAIVIDNATDRPIRYTLNGLDPTISSPRYLHEPIILQASPVELRFSYESEDGKKVSSFIFGSIF